MSNRSRVVLALGLFVVLALIVVVVVIVAVTMVSRTGFTFGGDRVALLRVQGQILDTRREVELARKYAEDGGIRAVVVRVESGGGAVGASQELFTELMRIREEEGKPVIVSFGNVAASGGYYVGLAGDRIFANPGSLTGSIGVLFTHADTSVLLRERIGVDFTDVTSGENKALASLWEPLSEQDRSLIEEMIGDVYNQFVGAVRDRRGAAIRTALAAEREGVEAQDISDAEVESHLVRLCDGRPFTGQQAVEWGFIDQLGTLQDAIDHAAKAAGITGEPTVVEWQPRRGLFGPMVEGVSDAVTTAVREELGTGAPLRYQMRVP
jgi:protease-4